MMVHTARVAAFYLFCHCFFIIAPHLCHDDSCIVCSGSSSFKSDRPTASVSTRPGSGGQLLVAPKPEAGYSRSPAKPARAPIETHASKPMKAKSSDFLAAATAGEDDAEAPSSGGLFEQLDVSNASNSLVYRCTISS